MNAIGVSVAVDTAVTVYTAVVSNVDVVIGAGIVVFRPEADTVDHAHKIWIGCVDQRDVEQHGARLPRGILSVRTCDGGVVADPVFDGVDKCTRRSREQVVLHLNAVD